MVSEIASSSLWMEEGWWVRQDVNKVTEEDVKRIQEDNQKAQKVWQEIKKDKAVNDKLANFLWFLLQNIKDEHIIKGIYEVFFKTKNEETDITYIRKNINTPLVVWAFVPFYIEEVKNQWLEEIFSPIYDLESKISLTKYTTYFKALLSTQEDDTPLDKHKLIDFIIHIAINYGLINNKLSSEEKAELKHTLSKELYWH